jgi:hypothetical protein
MHRQKLARYEAAGIEELRKGKQVGLVKTESSCGSEVSAEVLEHFVDLGEAAEVAL